MLIMGCCAAGIGSGLLGSFGDVMAYHSERMDVRKNAKKGTNENENSTHVFWGMIVNK